MKRFLYLPLLLSVLPLFIQAQEQGSGIPLKNKNEAKVAYNRGVESINEENYWVALEYLSTALDLNPEFAPAYLMRGKTNLELRKLNEAIQDFTMALEFDMNLGEANFYRGYANLNGEADPSVLEDFDLQ
jgi:tetratricopeptide (TPR) repeat protein